MYSDASGCSPKKNAFDISSACALATAFSQNAVFERAKDIPISNGATPSAPAATVNMAILYICYGYLKDRVLAAAAPVYAPNSFEIFI